LTLKQTIAAALIAISATGVAACGEGEPEDRGAAAVALCRDHGGVIAFDDEVVICRDQTSHQIE
jgi:hypothetical protein